MDTDGRQKKGDGALSKSDNQGNSNLSRAKTGEPQKRHCGNCYFSRRLAGRLHCLKNAPALDIDTGEARWPSVRKSDTCGQFRYIDQHNIDRDHWPRNELPVYTDRFGDYCKIPLTHGQFAKVDPEDYIWLSQFNWYHKPSKTTAYAIRSVKWNKKKKDIYMHRLLINTPAHLFCDHINHNGLDNRKQNLRNCTKKQNSANSRSLAKSSSKYKGVSWSKRRKKWAAYITSEGKQRHLGYFEKEVEGAKVYDRAAKKFRGRFAALNFPPD